MTTDAHADPSFVVLLFAHHPTPGVALPGMSPALPPERAADLQCVLLRYSWDETLRPFAGRRVLVYSPDDTEASMCDIVGGFQNGDEAWAQGEGRLDRRLRIAFMRANSDGPDAVIAVETDVPTLRPQRIAEAAAALASHDAVIGPTSTGGCLLVGLRRSAETGLGLFGGVGWDTDGALEQARRRAADLKLSLAELPAGHTVHRPADLLRAYAALSSSDEHHERSLAAALQPFVHELTFAIEGPHFLSESAMSSAQTIGSDTESTARILVVDDNAQNLELLLAYMEDLPGIELHSAMNGEEALQAVADAPPDLILLDVMMPRMSGFEVCKRLKENKKTRDIQIVMVTALNEQADIEKGADSGCDDFLTKPVNRVELLTRVKSLLRIREYKKRLDASGGSAGVADE